MMQMNTALPFVKTALPYVNKVVPKFHSVQRFSTMIEMYPRLMMMLTLFCSIILVYVIGRHY